MIYGVFASPTAETAATLAEFFEHCPIELNQTILLELGTTTQPEMELVATPGTVYGVQPRNFEIAHNPRTGNTSLFWVIDSLTRLTRDRMLEVGNVTDQHMKILLSHNIHAYPRRTKAYFNAKEDALYQISDLGQPLVLYFEKEFTLELDVFDDALLPQHRDRT